MKVGEEDDVKPKNCNQIRTTHTFPFSHKSIISWKQPCDVSTNKNFKSSSLPGCMSSKALYKLHEKLFITPQPVAKELFSFTVGKWKSFRSTSSFVFGNNTQELVDRHLWFLLARNPVLRFLPDLSDYSYGFCWSRDLLTGSFDSGNATHENPKRMMFNFSLFLFIF